MFFWKIRWVNYGILLRMLWVFQDRIERYLRELLIKEGTCGFDDDDEFFHWGRGLFYLLDGFFYGGQDFWMFKDLNRSVISSRELIRLSYWTGVSFGAWSLGGPQGFLYRGRCGFGGEDWEISLGGGWRGGCWFGGGDACGDSG